MKLFGYTASTHTQFLNQNLRLPHVAFLIFTTCVFFFPPHRIATAQTVHIPDPRLREVLEVALEKTAGPDITQAEIANLKALDAFESGIRNLTGLEFATNLTELHLGLNEISDITPLKDLTNLIYLDLHRNRHISDMSPLKDLTKLTWLSLRGNRISDMSPLKDLTNLTYLHIGYNKISDVSPLKNLINLTFLNLDANEISDISLLKGLTNLINLALDDNEISDVSPLKNLIKLIFLNLNDNRKISDVSPLKNLINLTFLDLHGNQMSDVSPLKNLTKLTNLKLHSNQILDVSSLNALTKLTRLDLHGNEISDLSPLKNLTKLTFLDLHDNEISDVSPLKDLVNLTTLNLSGNHISDFSPLAGLIDNLTAYDTSNQTEPSTPSADVNRDGIVNIIDIVRITSNFDAPDLVALAAKSIYPDVNSDGTIDVRDLVIVAAEMSSDAAAPLLSKYPAEVSNLTVENLDHWIRLAKHLDTEEHQTQKGIAALERLLLTLTLGEQLPEDTALLANYPNPFNPETWIPYQLASPAVVRIAIHSADGKLVRRLDLGVLPVGMYHSKSRAAYWDGRNEIGEAVASGVYFYTFIDGNFTATGKMLIRK